MTATTNKHWAVAGMSVVVLSWAGWVSTSLIEIDRVQEAVLARLTAQSEHNIEVLGRIRSTEDKIASLPNRVNDKDRWTGSNQKDYAGYVVKYIDLKDDALENRIDRLEDYHPPKNQIWDSK